MSLETDTRDRLIRLEATVEHQSEKIDDVTKKLDAAIGKLNSMHDLFQQASGAKWALIAIASVLGFAGAKLAAFIQWPK